MRLNLPRSLLIQPTQISLPAHGNAPREHVPELRRDIHEAERRDHGPELGAVDDTPGQGDFEAFKGFLERGAREQGVDAEEVGVEERGEDGLLDEDFCED